VDITKAVEWWHAAAQNGDLDGIILYAKSLIIGGAYGTKNESGAIEWLRLARSQGSNEAGVHSRPPERPHLAHRYRTTC
jgi:TPR repeat protein